jgi:hypothetical protein
VADSGMQDVSSNRVLNYATAVAIANGATESGAASLGEYTLVGLLMPAAVTGTTVKFLSAEALAGTYRTVTDGAGTDYSVTVAASKYVPVDLTKLSGVRFLKVVSGSAEGAARSVVLALRRV